MRLHTTSGAHALTLSSPTHTCPHSLPRCHRGTTSKPSCIPSLHHTPRRKSLRRSALEHAHSHQSSPEPSDPSLHASLASPQGSAADADSTYEGSHPSMSALARSLPVCLLVTSLVSAKAARAEERPWKPRRHYRRLGEHIPDTWAEDLVQEQEAALDQSIAARRRQRQLQREQEEREAAQRKADEAARRQRVEKMLAKEAEAARKRSDLPFSIKIGGAELAPFIVWGGVGFMAYGAFRGMVAANNARLGRGRGKGRWVSDRSLGGRMVWVPDYTPSSAPGGVRMSDIELNRVTSIAAAAASAPVEEGPKEFVIPDWWNPGPRFVADPSVQASRAEAASRLLQRIESSKVSGSDYDLKDIVRLRTLCQEGCVTVKPRTVGSRDAIFRTAVEAAVAVAQDPIESGADIGDVAPTRFVCALAYDLGVPEERAVSITKAATAAATRARLLDALAGIKEDEVGEGGAGGARLGETEAVLALIRLSSLFEKMPVLEPGGKEVSLIADSLKGTFGDSTRRKAFHMIGQLYPESAVLAAQTLGFDPAQEVPQLLADVDRCHRQAEEANKSRQGQGRQQQ